MDRRRGLSGFRTGLLALAAAMMAMTIAARARGEELAVAGLRRPVEIVRDRWGIAHIYARDEHDLFLAQGYNAARDRLFQLELWRRRATGTLAEIQGPRALAGDVGARLLRFRGDMAGELDHYHPRGAAIVGAFVQGINAYIEQTEREPARLPIEFRILGIKPGQMDPRGRRLAAQRAVPQRRPGGGGRPARPPPGPGPGPGPAQPAPRATRGSSPTRRSTCRSSRTGSWRPTGPRATRSGSGPRTSRRRSATGRRARTRPRARRRCGGHRPGASTGDRSRRPGEQQLGHRRRPDVLGRRDHGQRPAPEPAAAVACGTGSTWSRPAGTSSAPASRRLPGVSVGHNEHGAWGFTIFPVGPGRPLRLRDRPRGPVAIPIPGRMGGDADGPGDLRGEGGRAGRGRPDVHPARAGRRGGPGPSSGLCDPGRLARAGRGALPGEPPDRPGGELGRVPRGVPVLPRPVREHGLGRPRRPHRLAGRGPGAASPGVGRPAAGPGGRALRVGRVPAGAGAAAPGRPAPGLVRLGQPGQPAAGLSVRGQLPVDRAVPVRADRGGARRVAAGSTSPTRCGSSRTSCRCRRGRWCRCSGA